MKPNYFICIISIVLTFSHCKPSEGDNFMTVPPEGFAELTIIVRQWTSDTEWEVRGGAVVTLYEAESDRVSLSNETHINNTDNSGHCIFIDVPKSSTLYLRSVLLDEAIKETELELTDSDIQSEIIMHDI